MFLLIVTDAERLFAKLIYGYETVFSSGFEFAFITLAPPKVRSRVVFKRGDFMKGVSTSSQEDHFSTSLFAMRELAINPPFGVALSSPEKAVQTPTGLSYYRAKRVLDIALTVLALLFTWPLFLIIALVIRLDSRGSAVYKQERVGSRCHLVEGRVFWERYTFTMYKFRSMYQGSASSSHEAFMKKLINDELDEQDLSTPKVYKLTNDTRVTRVGRFLRATSLDELPQIFNVLKGDMSLVGPRPAIGYEVANYKQWHYKRLAAKPGVTGYWQVKGRSNVSFHKMVELDLHYITHQSIRLDLNILFLTVTQVLRRRGAV